MTDDLDRRLIALLRADARTPHAELARRLSVSRGTVMNRMRRLERDGTVLGYTVTLAAETDEPPIRALMMVAVEGNRAAAVVRTLRGEAAVTVLYTTNGRWDIVAELRLDTLEEFDRLLGRVRLLEGVVQSETSLLLKDLRAGDGRG